MGPGGRDARASVAGPSAVCVAAALAAAMAAAACGRAASPAPASANAGDAGFVAPPVVLRADPTPAGGLRLVGRAPPDAIVRLAAPDGRALGAAADRDGRWSTELPPATAPQLFSLSADVGGRTLRAEGALAQAPAPARAPGLLARAGAPAVPLGGDVGALDPQTRGPRIAAVDFDRGGGLAVSGRAAPEARLRLHVDGAPMGAGQADAAGRFGLLDVGAQVRAGAHRVRVTATDGAADEIALDTSAPAPLAGPYRAARAGEGWRIDWAPPGGGVQSLFVPDAPAAPAASPPVRTAAR